jgi:uncharacterized protein with HEPN domain
MKAQRDHRVYLHDMLTAIAKVEEYATVGERVFYADGKTQDAVIRQISIIGEAASRLPAAITAKHKSIPWKNIIGMRNIVVHDYSEINLERVWEVAKRDARPLKIALEAIIKSLEE